MYVPGWCANEILAAGFRPLKPPAGIECRGGGLAGEEPQEVAHGEYELVYERVVAVDVAKVSGVVCGRVPDESRPGRRYCRVWTVNTVTELGDHLRCQQLQIVTLESPDYGRSWHVVLEPARLRVQLVNARAVKNCHRRTVSA